MRGRSTTAWTVPEARENAPALTGGLAFSPVSVQAIHCPSDGVSTVPRGSVHAPVWARPGAASAAV